VKQTLINKAMEVRNRAYAPYSQFKVGAALLSNSNTIYTGCNIENSSYSLTCCAERVAIFNAVANGENEFKSLVVVADTLEPVSPCGACRQVMSEFFTEETKVYLMNNSNDIRCVTIKELLPYSFNLND